MSQPPEISDGDEQVPTAPAVRLERQLELGNGRLFARVDAVAR